MTCIWPDCGHDTNQSDPSPGCNGKFCPVSQKLLPCPCGRPAQVSATDSAGRRSASCDSEDCYWSIVAFTDEQLIERWNRRATPPNPEWVWLIQKFDSIKTSASERVLDALGLPISEAAMPLYHIIRRHLKDQNG